MKKENLSYKNSLLYRKEKTAHLSSISINHYESETKNLLKEEVSREARIKEDRPKEDLGRLLTQTQQMDLILSKALKRKRLCQIVLLPSWYP